VEHDHRKRRDKRGLADLADPFTLTRLLVYLHLWVSGIYIINCMVSSCSVRLLLRIVVWVSWVGFGTLGLPANATPTATEIVQKAVERAQQMESRGRPGYSYRKVSVTEELDPVGKVKERKEKVYEVSFREGSTLARLLQVNGHPPCRTDMKEQTENETNARHMFGHSKEHQGNIEQNFFTPELVARFDFKLICETNLNGRVAYQLQFGPKNPQLEIHTIFDRLLNQLSGTIWIDAEEFEVARAQLRLNSEVDLLWGVVGCLKKLTYTVSRARVGDGIWLNSDSNGNFEGRKLLDSLRVNLRTQNSNFRLFP